MRSANLEPRVFFASYYDTIMLDASGAMRMDK